MLRFAKRGVAPKPDRAKADEVEPQYGWHTVAWVSIGVLAAVAFFRLGGWGMDRHENLPDETTGLAIGCLNTVARMVCGLTVALAIQFALFGWPFMGWSARV
jgi:hypothetical protein